MRPAADRRRARPSPRTRRRCARPRHVSPRASRRAASASARVVFPEPAGPSTQTSRVVPQPGPESVEIQRSASCSGVTGCRACAGSPRCRPCRHRRSPWSPWSPWDLRGLRLPRGCSVAGAARRPGLPGGRHLLRGPPPAPRRSIQPLTTNSTTETPATTSPSHTTGLNTSRAAQLDDRVGDLPAEPAARRSARRRAAAGSRRARPRRPAPDRDRRTASPTIVSTRPSACRSAVSGPACRRACHVARVDAPVSSLRLRRPRSRTWPARWAAPWTSCAWDHARVRTIPDPGFAGDDGSAAPEVDGRPGGVRPDPTADTPRRSRSLQHAPAARAGGGRARRGRARRAGAGPRQDLRHGHRAHAGPGRPDGAAGVHRHRGAAPVEPGRAGRCRCRSPTPPGPPSTTAPTRSWSTSPDRCCSCRGRRPRAPSPTGSRSPSSAGRHALGVRQPADGRGEQRTMCVGGHAGCYPVRDRPAVSRPSRRRASCLQV